MTVPHPRCRVVFVALLFVLALPLLASDGSEGIDNEALRTTEGLLELIESESEDYLLVDVRTAPEYESGHIPTAINIHYWDIVEDLPEGTKDRLIIVYCQSGVRSGRAFRWLRRAGYTNVVDFGGIERWRGPVVREETEG